jgi:hypothetical protein
MAKQSPRLLELARREAEARFQDLVHEARLLVELFPHLRDSYDPDELPVSFIVAKGSGQLKKKGGAGRRLKRPRKKDGRG